MFAACHQILLLKFELRKKKPARWWRWARHPLVADRFLVLQRLKKAAVDEKEVEEVTAASGGPAPKPGPRPRPADDDNKESDAKKPRFGFRSVNTD